MFSHLILHWSFAYNSNRCAGLVPSIRGSRGSANQSNQSSTDTECFCSLLCSQAQIELEEWDAAEKSLETVTNICGTQDVDVRRLSRKLSQLKDAQARKEQRCYQAMFPSS